MTDFLAGQTLTALHFPPTVSNTQNGLFTFNLTTFGIDADTGSYVDCGVAFVACATGRAVIHYAGDLDNDGASGATEVAPFVRTGSTVGSGTTVVAASSDDAIRNIGTSNVRYGAHRFVSGLTPGSSYNVRLEHRVSGGIGTIQRRIVTVEPCT